MNSKGETAPCRRRPGYRGFCLDPVAARRTRRRLLEECASQPQLLLPAHFAPPCAFEVSAKGDTFVLNV